MKAKCVIQAGTDWVDIQPPELGIGEKTRYIYVNMTTLSLLLEGGYEN